MSTSEFDALCGKTDGLFEEYKLAFGIAVGGGAFMLIGAFVRLAAEPVPVLYWSLVPPWLHPARANAAHNNISVLFIVISFV